MPNESFAEEFIDKVREQCRVLAVHNLAGEHVRIVVSLPVWQKLVSYYVGINSTLLGQSAVCTVPLIVRFEGIDVWIEPLGLNPVLGGALPA